MLVKGKSSEDALLLESRGDRRRFVRRDGDELVEKLSLIEEFRTDARKRRRKIMRVGCALDRGLFQPFGSEQGEIYRSGQRAVRLIGADVCLPGSLRMNSFFAAIYPR